MVQPLRPRKRVLLLNPPASRPCHRDGYCSNLTKSSYLWPPLDLLIQSGYLAERELRVIDAVAERRDAASVFDEAAGFRPDLILTLVGEAVAEEDRRFVARLRERSGAFLVLSGDSARFAPAASFADHPAADAILMDFLCDALARWPEPSPDLVLRADAEQASPPRPRRDPLDYPTPRHDLFRARRYRLPYPGMQRFGTLLASVGCPNTCRFCQLPSYGYRRRPLPDVLDEVRSLRGLGVRSLFFRDPNFNADHAHAMGLCRALVSEGLVMPWITFVAATRRGGDLFPAMAAAGCRLVMVGVEAPDDEQRARLGKRVADETIRSTVRAAHAAGIQVSGHFIIGAPGQSEAQAEATLAFARRLALDYAVFTPAEQRPGTGWAESGAPLAPPDWSPAKKAASLTLRSCLRPAFLAARVRDIRSPRDLHTLASVGLDLVGGAVERIYRPRRSPGTK